MSNKAFLFMFSLLFSLLLTVVWIQRNKVRIVEKAVNVSIQKQHNLEDYVLSSFIIDRFSGKVEVSEICLPFLKDDGIIVYLPSGLCRACFSSLLFAFQDHGISGSTVTVISAREDFEVKAECLARGMRYVVNDRAENLVTDIVLYRLYRNYLPVALDYNLGRDALLPIFFSENERLLQILSGAG